MKQNYVKNCKGCNRVMYGYNLPPFCCSVCEERYNNKPEEGRPKEVSHDVTLNDLGINRMQSTRWQQLPTIPEPTFNEELQKLKTKKTEITTNHFLKIAKIKKFKL